MGQSNKQGAFAAREPEPAVVRQMQHLVGTGPFPAFSPPIPKPYGPIPGLLQDGESEGATEQSPPAADPTASASGDGGRYQPAVTAEHALPKRPASRPVTSGPIALAVAPIGTGSAQVTASLGVPQPHRAVQTRAADIKVYGNSDSPGTLAGEWERANASVDTAHSRAIEAGRVADHARGRARRAFESAKRSEEAAKEQEAKGAAEESRRFTELAWEQKQAGKQARAEALFSDLQKKNAERETENGAAERRAIETTLVRLDPDGLANVKRVGS